MAESKQNQFAIGSFVAYPCSLANKEPRQAGLVAQTNLRQLGEIRRSSGGEYGEVVRRRLHGQASLLRIHRK